MTPHDPDYYPASAPLAKPLSIEECGRPTRDAVAVFKAFRDDPLFCREPNPFEIRLIAAFLDEYIHAPCFVYASAELVRLRREVIYIRTLLHLVDWLWDAAAIGIEPL